MKWATDPGSIGIFGHTQTGKTTIARQVHAENQRISVWLNKAAEPVPNVSGKRVSGLRAILSGMKDGQRKFNYISRNPQQDFEELRSWMFELADSYGRETPLQVVGDEWEEIAPETNKTSHTGRDATWKLIKEGQKRNVKGIFITQDPTAISKKCMRQTEYTLLFENHFSQKDSLERLGLPFEKAQQLPDYHALAIASNGTVMDTVTGKAKYA